MAKIKILHFSTHNEDCGVGKYQEQFLESMQSLNEVENKFFEYSPNQMKTMSKDELNEVIEKLSHEIKNYDILHVQHEFAFYPGEQFARVCETAKHHNKKLIITYHTSPDWVIRKLGLGGLGPRSVMHFLRSRRYYRRMLKNHIAPAYSANAVVIHNRFSEKALIDLSIDKDKICRLQMPVPVTKQYKDESTEFGEAFQKQPGDIIFCTVGFLHRYKGLFDAVKSLKFLPDNYKLGIIGGDNPASAEDKIYNQLTDLIIRLDLANRIYITGFVKDDDSLNKLIRECDLCIYPYDKHYYSRVSSAALNLAFANQMPVVAYPVETFIEIANESKAILLTNGFSYYELARSIKNANPHVLRERSAKYAKDASYPVIAKDLVKIYEAVVADT